MPDNILYKKKIKFEGAMAYRSDQTALVLPEMAVAREKACAEPVVQEHLGYFYLFIYLC